jgi:hypothetical protein
MLAGYTAKNNKERGYGKNNTLKVQALELRIGHKESPIY